MPNLQHHHRPEPWSTPLHAQENVLARENADVHAHKCTHVVDRISCSYTSLEGKSFSVHVQMLKHTHTHTHIVDHCGGQGRQRSCTQSASQQSLIEESQHESLQSFCSSQTHHSLHTRPESVWCSRGMSRMWLDMYCYMLYCCKTGKSSDKLLTCRCTWKLSRL